MTFSLVAPGVIIGDTARLRHGSGNERSVARDFSDESGDLFGIDQFADHCVGLLRLRFGVLDDEA